MMYVKWQVSFGSLSSDELESRGDRSLDPEQPFPIEPIFLIWSGVIFFFDAVPTPFASLRPIFSISDRFGALSTSHIHVFLSI